MNTLALKQTGLSPLDDHELAAVLGGVTGLDAIGLLVALLVSFSGVRDTGVMLGNALVSMGILDLSLSSSQAVGIRRGSL